MVKSRKIYYIANVRMPTEKAHGVQIAKTCEALATLGAEVELIVPDRKSTIKEDIFDFYGIKKNSFIFRREKCFDFVGLNYFGPLGYWLQTLYFYWKLKLNLVEQPDTVYYTRDLPLAFLLTFKFKPVFLELHSLPDAYGYFYKKISWPLYKLAFKRFAGIVVISKGLEKALVQRGIDNRKILIARDGADVFQYVTRDVPMDKIKARETLDLPVNKQIVVYTGHLYEWKGAQVLARSANLEEVKNVQFYLVGGTNEDVKTFKKKYRRIKNLHVIGWVSPKLVPMWQWAADVLVIPTSGRSDIGQLYTSPLKLFEYMMSKRPIVAARISSINEILDRSSGTFFDSDSQYSLAQAIKKVLENEDEAKNKAEVAFNRATTEFTWGCRAALILNFLFSN